MSIRHDGFGRLERVNLRDYWPREDIHFTPWLAEQANLEILGEALGMNLALVDTELRVGPYRADIYCEDLASSSNIVIENQLEVTDHNHLGQSIAYAAGLEAQAVVWIAERFTPEHEAAFDWLNTATQDAYSFFGVQIELWRIGSSPPAPRFEVLAKPNEWRRATGRALRRGRSGSVERYADWKDFWESFVLHAKTSKNRYPAPVPAARPWIYLPWSLDPVKITASYSRTKNRTAIYVLTPDEGSYVILEQRIAELIVSPGSVVRWKPERTGPQDGGFFAIDEEDTEGDESNRYEWLNHNLELLYPWLSDVLRPSS